MNLSDNYPIGVSEATINGHFGNTFNSWFEQNEDYLLERFIDYWQDVVIIPPVKEWGPAIMRMWTAFVDDAWNDRDEYEGNGD